MKPDHSNFSLYTHPLSANGRKVMALATLLNLDPDIHLVNVYQGEGQQQDYLNINPLGQIPALFDHRKNKSVLESNNILVYMTEEFSNLSYFPSDKRSDILQWLFWESSQWQPAISTTIQQVVAYKLLPNLFPAPTENTNWDNAPMARVLHYLNSHLNSKPYLSGNELTIADISVAGMMTYFRFAQFPFERYPAINGWYKKIERLEAWVLSAAPLWQTNS